MKQLKSSRRHFLKQAVQLLLGIGGIKSMLAMPGCGPSRYVSFRQQKDRLVVSKKHFQDRDFVLLQPNQLSAPLFVKQLSSTNYKAISLLCQHRGCTVKPAGAILKCPCHGSEYTQKGKVLSGPSVERLTEYPTSQDQNKVYIKLNAS